MQQRLSLFSFSLVLSCFLFASNAHSVSSLATTTTVSKTSPHGWVWEQITVGQDDSLTRIFLRQGLTEQDVYHIMHVSPSPDALLKLKPGQKIQLALAKSKNSPTQLNGLRLIIDNSNTLEITASESGFISNQGASIPSKVQAQTSEPEKIAELANTNYPEQLTTTIAEPTGPVMESHHPTEQDIALGLVWKQVIVEKNDSLTTLFLREGLTATDVYRVTQSKPKPEALFNLIPGQVLRLALHDTDSGALALQELQLKIDIIDSLSITATDSGFVTKTETREIEYRELKTKGKITSSLFMAGKEAGLADKVIMKLASLFNWDIDFALDIRENDSFSLIYQQGYLDNKEVDDVTILAAEFINQEHVYRAIRYTNAKDETGYFTPKGESMRKAFIRTPIDFARVSSHFNLKRKHPILNRIRAHKGVDYAASRGTPIKATGRATIKSIGNQRGYGRTIVLKHAGKYTTLYAHMKSFAKGLRKGSRVKQGQTIGYVGSSGLATGPHLHYEFRINGVHRNPLTVKLPRSLSLEKQYQIDFKAKALPLIEKLDSLNQAAAAQEPSE